MGGAHIGSPEMLHLLWLVPLLLGLAFYRFRWKDKALQRFAEPALLRHINLSTSRARQWGKAVLILGAIAFFIMALARPAWNPRAERVERKGRDVVIVLDVSRSMLAEDLRPNRLERAKIAVKDLVDKLEGDRVGLVIFAGSSMVRCPLTLDYGFFRSMLDDVSVDSISRGGTLIGDALRRTVDEIFSDKLKRFKDVILITDGEDHDSYAVEAAREAGERGVRLIAIGLGDEKEGRRIPFTNEKGERTFLSYQGKEVWTRLDAETLRKMVAETPGGSYLNVATGDFDLGSIYLNLVASAEKTDLESQTIRRYDEKFQIFLGFGLFLLLMEMLVSERKLTPRPAGAPK